MKKTLLYGVYFCFLAALGILLGCYIHAARVNQTTAHSGVAFVRELPYGELIVGYTESVVFSRLEQRDLERYREEHKGKIQIDPKVLEEQKKLLGEGSDKP